MVRALDRADEALARNARHATARHVRMLVLRTLGRLRDATRVLVESLEADPLDAGALNERILLARTTGDAGDEAGATVEWLAFTRGEPSATLDLAARYAACGAHADAIDLLTRAASLPDARERRAPGHDGPTGAPNLRPLLHYAAGHYAERAADGALARERPRLVREAALHRARGAASDRSACFPNGLEHQAVLESALAANPGDATAAYLLGLLWYDRREPARARAAWTIARRLEPGHAATHRNLAILAFNTRRAPAEALRSMRRAFALDPGDARLLFELDLLEKRCGVTPGRRLARLERHAALVATRDDLSIERVTLLNGAGRHQRALDLLLSRRFHPWEGGEGKAPAQHRAALTGLARRALERNRPDDAVRLLERSREYPESLGEGRLHGTLENETLYRLGVAHDRAGCRRDARRCWSEASRGMRAPSAALYYNDQDPATIAWQGLALRALGRERAARERFTTLVRFGADHLRDPVEIDYFAVSLPEFQVFDDDLARRHEVNCRFLRALGWWGLGARARARAELGRVLVLDPAHQAARLTLRWGL
jgi:tetratricopeptide (TPR) repeat protein